SPRTHYTFHNTLCYERGEAEREGNLVSSETRNMRVVSLLSIQILCITSLKFLVFSPQFAKSHVNFQAKLSDFLVDAGHEVVMVSPVFTSGIGPMTKKVRVIEIPLNDVNASDDTSADENSGFSFNAWESSNSIQMFLSSMGMFELWANACESVINDVELIDKLKAEKFDAAFAESLDKCGPVLFHLAGVNKWAVTESVAITDGTFYYTQTPTNLAYIPSLSGGAGESMNFFERLSNIIEFTITDLFLGMATTDLENTLKKRMPHLPDVKEIMASNSLVFFNSDPLVDFPRITSARTIDIGGITVSSEHQPLNETWSNILNLRAKTIYISFGSIAISCDMPEEYKKTIQETVKSFPDVTFIWKYEKPEHKISEGIPNLVESSWVPQRDLLYDPRLTAFITHCGQGSTTEAIDAAMPLIVIPVMGGDQSRNAYQIERNGNGIRLEKTDLASTGKLQHAIREMLENDRYRKKARSIKQMIAGRPFSMKEIFVKNMEFLAKHGPLRQLDHYGRNLNFIQYYLIDVVVFVATMLIIVCVVVTCAIRALARRLFIAKVKLDYQPVNVD
ncbi:hypothetical protein PFISCL1PPCAC_13618, partial [Pristionchus fissidentatus]